MSNNPGANRVLESETLNTLKVTKNALVAQLVTQQAFIQDAKINSLNVSSLTVHTLETEPITGENIGIGEGKILAAIEPGPPNNLLFKTIAGGTNISVTDTDDTIVLSTPATTFSGQASTNNALVLWDGESGTKLKQSSVVPPISVNPDTNDILNANTIELKATSNQIIMGSGASVLQLSAPTPASTQTVTLSDPGASASVIYDVKAQTLTGLKTFNGGLRLLTSGATQTTLNFYTEETHVTEFKNGGNSTGFVTLRLSRIGNQVSCQIPDLSFTGTGAADLLQQTAFPAYFRPTTNRFILPVVVNDGATAIALGFGRMDPPASGLLDFIPASGVWTNAAACTVYATVLNWTTA